MTTPEPRDLIIADCPSDARRYAKDHGIQRPIVVDLSRPVPEAVLRGLNLDGYRIHDISDFMPPTIMARLRQLAGFAGHPLESFCVTTASEDAA